jgi:tetratricopeptide (TPR) repeat protein
MAIRRKVGIVLSGLAATFLTLAADALWNVRCRQAAISLARFGLARLRSFESTFSSQLALFHEESNDFDLAIKELSGAIQRGDDTATRYFEIGLLYERKRQFHAAIKNFERALQLGTDFGAEFRLALERKIDALKALQDR